MGLGKAGPSQHHSTHVSTWWTPPSTPPAAHTPGLTTVLEGLVRPVPAVPDGVAHFVQGDALTALALELVGPLTKSHYENHRGGSGASRRQEVA